MARQCKLYLYNINLELIRIKSIQLFSGPSCFFERQLVSLQCLPCRLTNTQALDIESNQDETMRQDGIFLGS